MLGERPLQGHRCDLSRQTECPAGSQGALGEIRRGGESVQSLSCVSSSASPDLIALLVLGLGQLISLVQPQWPRL